MAAKVYKNYFDIVILPPKEVRDYAIRLSKQLYKHYGSRWVLGKESFLPHISLYHIPVKPRDFEDFITELKNTIKGFKAGGLKIEEIRVWEPHYSILLTTNKPEWLRNLYLKIIKNSLKYFDWDYEIEKLWNTEKLPELMKKNLKKYGTPMVGKYFMPHITLGVFENKKDMNSGVRELKLEKYNFEVKGISGCELGESHSCQRIIKQIYF